MQALLNAGPSCALPHLVVFVGRAFHVVHRGILRPIEAGYQHLRQARIFRPGNAIVLILSELVHAEVRTDAREPRIGDDLFKF